MESWQLSALSGSEVTTNSYVSLWKVEQFKLSYIYTIVCLDQYEHTYTRMYVLNVSACMSVCAKYVLLHYEMCCVEG